MIDRIRFAAGLARGRKVLDVGGSKMAGTDPRSRFAREYSRIAAGALEYRNVDVQENADERIDLNQPGSVDALRAVIDRFRPEVILCMETLEHVNYHFEAMNALADAVARFGTRVFITVPNNGNWLLNAAGWNHDHCVGFVDGVASRFVRRSNLGRHKVTEYGCTGQYHWWCWLVIAAAFGQPLSWGFLVEPGRQE